MNINKARKNTGVTPHGGSFRYRKTIKLANGVESKRSRTICSIDEPEHVFYKSLARAKKEIEADQDKLILNDLWVLWQNKPSYSKRSQGTITNERMAFNVLNNYFAEKPIDDIRLVDVSQFVNLRLSKNNGLTDHKKSASPEGARKEKGLLTRLFDWGAQLGYCHQIDTRRIETPKQPPRDMVIEDWQFDALINEANEICRLFIVGAYLLGARQGDMRKLLISDCQSKGIYIQQAKTGIKQIKSYNSDVEEWLATALTRYNQIKADCEKKGNAIPMTLLCKSNGTAYSKSGIISMFNRLKETVEKKTGMESKLRFTFHTIKHTSITNFSTKATGSSKQDFSGHKSKAMLAVYDHEVPVAPSNTLPKVKQEDDISAKNELIRDTILQFKKVGG